MLSSGLIHASTVIALLFLHALVIRCPATLVSDKSTNAASLLVRSEVPVSVMAPCTKVRSAAGTIPETSRITVAPAVSLKS
jgi:hypothetical protein